MLKIVMASFIVASGIWNSAASQTLVEIPGDMSLELPATTSSKDVPEKSDTEENDKQTISTTDIDETIDETKPVQPESAENKTAKKSGLALKFFSPYNETGLYALISLDHSFSLNPLLEAGNLFGICLQWRQSPWLSFFLRFESGIFSLQPVTLVATSPNNSYAIAISRESSAGLTGLAVGPILHLPLKNFLEGKLTPEFGVSFIWEKFRTGHLEFSDIFGASFKMGASWEPITRLKLGLTATLDLGEINKINLDGKTYVLDQKANTTGIYLSLFVGYRLF